ncbi:MULTISPECIES: FAD-dependent oxidoreductase [Streptomyces]|nr:hypothetical protein FNV64_52545 [Streptomyces sp. S1A1-7]
MSLLGDSAHAMEPFQTQGAPQAIRDAAVLGDALAGATSPEPEFPDALDRYAHRRLSIATSVRAGSARASEDHHLPIRCRAAASRKSSTTTRTSGAKPRAPGTGCPLVRDR